MSRKLDIVWEEPEKGITRWVFEGVTLFTCNPGFLEFQEADGTITIMPLRRIVAVRVQEESEEDDD